MAVCPVCGCKTDELDFVETKVNAMPYKVCSFCEKQLSGFADGAECTEAQGRWLDAVLTKEVPERSNELTKALSELRGQMIKPVEPVNMQKAPVNMNGFAPDGFAAPQRQAQGGFNSQPIGSNEVAELQKRVEALENELKAMKRRQFIKTAFEIGLPIILGIMILIVFFSSGLYDSLRSLMSYFN